LLYSYFTRIPKKNPQPGENNVHALVNNGWIWNADPLVNFASESDAYFLRKVIVWGDCVKLNYGKSPEDNPWLWNHMKEYSVKMAEMFHGFRIDNCHSTPIHLAQYLLDASRKVRPNLYVVAELFTGSEEKDLIFVSKLGINSLIREAIVSWDAAEQSRLIHRYGGQPVGSFYVTLENCDFNQTEELDSMELIAEGSAPHALFMECTHDNETPFQRRTAEDALPNAALTCFTASAIGSVHGYDELYPELLNLVNETRIYSKCFHTLVNSINKDVTNDILNPFLPQSFLQIKLYLQALHIYLSDKHYSEVYVHRDREIIRIIRDNPVNHHGFLLIAHTSFRKNHSSEFEEIRIRGSNVKLITGGTLTVNTTKKTTNELIGFDSCVISNVEDMFKIETGRDANGEYVDIKLKQFPQGSILIFEKKLQTKAVESLNAIQSILKMKYPTNKLSDATKCIKSLDDAISKLHFNDLNVLLYRCENEEHESTGHSVYVVPNYGPVAYCGLQGFMSIMRWVAKENNLGHPFCHHLRNGPWALNYIYERLERQLDQYPNLQDIYHWLKSLLNNVKELPFYLWPKYFYLVLTSAYTSARKHGIIMMSEFIKNNDSFVHSLALGSIQMCGSVKSTGLFPVEPYGPSLAAGLPHFSNGFMRCWGRDIFIALRGIFLLTGRFKEAKEHILAFTSVVRHGLVPNLLDSGRKPRYNARDAVWFCLQSIQDYCKISPEGEKFLDESFKRRFPTDEYIPVSDPRSFYTSMTIREFIFHVLQRHAEGIHFREHNAGPDLDRVMTNQGFNIDIETSWKTGLVFGGNAWNCGTWMDKMGESVKAGTSGRPATSRDGAAIEINGLLKSTLRWIVELQAKGLFQFEGVKVNDRTITFEEWNDLLQRNFEKCFYVPLNAEQDYDYYVDSSIIHRRGMYKDCFMSTPPFRDYQLRPNFCIAYVVVSLEELTKTGT
jgi:glycogen debranching enzyme